MFEEQKVEKLDQFSKKNLPANRMEPKNSHIQNVSP
jgi:hypothetical protein